MSPFLRFSAITACLLLAAAAVAAPALAAPASCTDGIATAAPGRFCRSFEDCKAFCSCACTFDVHKWKSNVKNDGSTSCPNAPTTGPGIIASDSTDLVDLPTYRFITHRAHERTARAALDGLQRLDDHLAGSHSREQYGFTVRVVSCYRPQLEDTEPECGIVLKSAYMLDRTTDPTERKKWLKTGNPQNLGLAWPGATPHSAGIACDLVLVDSHGQDSFDTRAGVAGAPTSSINQRLASKMLDEEVTNAEVGGSRLTYEAWHYEWGEGGSGSLCKDPECNERHWPVTGHP
jgi:hypothetical protein